MYRSARACFIALCLAATSLVGSHARVTAEDGSLDLASPAAGISDPASDVEPVEMVCADGQADINSASEGELRSALGISKPVARRVIESRPYLRVSDLTIVAGIGPGKLSAIENAASACALPSQTPPPVFDVCEDDSLDFNFATFAEITAQYRISRPIAQRVVDAQPFLRLSDLSRVPGMSGKKLRDVVQNGCLTPWPIVTQNAQYHWASEANGGYLEDGDWLMAVQPGVVDSGAWLAITQIDDPGLLQADFTIEGSWSGRVILGMPQEEIFLEGWDIPIVMHSPDSPDLFWIDESLFETGTGLRFSTETLSPYGTTNLPVGPDPAGSFLYQATIEPFFGPFEFTAEDARRAAIIDMFDNINSGYSTIPGCENTSALIMDSNAPDDLFGCELDEDSAAWTIANNTGNDLGGLLGYPILVKTTTSGDLQGEFVPANESNVQSVVEQTAANLSFTTPDNEVYTIAGSKARLSLPSAGTTGRAVMNVQTKDTITMSAVAEAINALELIPGVNAAGAVGICTVSGVTVLGQNGREFIACLMEEAGEAAADTAIVASKLTKLRGALKSFGKILIVVDTALTAEDALDINNSFIDFEHRRIVSPPSGGGGGLGSAPVGPNGGPDGTLPSDVSISNVPDGLIVRGYINESDSFIVPEGERVAYPISSGGDYVCLAQSYPVWDQPQSFVWSNTEASLTCDPFALTPRVIPANASNWIIRIGETGQSYYMAGDSRVYEIRDGGCYQLLASQYFVLDWTAAEALDALDVVPGPSNSAC